MSSKILVLTTVHAPDDPRVRLKTVGVLARRFPVVYAARPSPRKVDGFEWYPLQGGRFRRNLGAVPACWRRDVGVVVVHDPELLPLALLTRWLRRIPVVFDLHEDLPIQILHKHHIPRIGRVPLSALARMLLWLAGRHLEVTLANPSCQPYFRRRQMLFPNYPLAGTLPAPAPDGRYIAYVGSVTRARGASVLVEAVSLMQHPLPLHIAGPCSAALSEELEKQAGRLGVQLHLHGSVDHDAALDLVARSSASVSPLLDTPAYRTSLPTKVVEYLTLGVPIVASDLPATADLLRPIPSARLAPPGDAAAMARALDDVTTDPECRAQAQVAGQCARARYTWPEEELLDFYQGLLERDPRTGHHRSPGDGG